MNGKDLYLILSKCLLDTLAFGMTLSESAYAIPSVSQTVVSNSTHDIAILSLRIWSIWRRSYKIGLLMVGFFCAVGCVVLIYLTIYLNSLNCMPPSDRFLNIYAFSLTLIYRPNFPVASLILPIRRR